MNIRATAAVRLLAGDKEPVRAASTANLALAGLSTVDGVVLVAGDRVLVKSQTDATQNGIYTASEGIWQRAPDFNYSRAMIAGMKVAVQEGSTHANDMWRLVTDRPDIGEDDIEFAIFINAALIADATAAVAAAEAAAAEAVAAAATFQAESLTFDTRTEAIAADIPPGVTSITTKGYTAIGDGGGGEYKRVGSFPSHEGYIESQDGAWWELMGSRVSVRQFGAVPAVANLDTDPDAAAAINLCMEYCNLKHANMRIPAGQWPLDAAITAPTFIIEISGEQGGGQPTVLYKRYVEADANKGIISLGAWGATITDIQMAAKAGASGGSGFSAILPNNAANIGILRIRNLYISCGDGVNQSLNINGTVNTGGLGGTGGHSYRSVFLENCHFFGAAQYSVVLLGVRHLFAKSVYTDVSGGTTSSGYVMNVAGAASSGNDDIYWDGIIAGNLNLDNLARSVFNSVVTGSIDNSVNVASTTVIRCLGTVVSNWTNSRAIN
ncbi:hypothetical protein [Bradyrhizobium japonicum]|uniref:hypothetical protein n=1 Tax=Bradyrhizobium japonicum TaxID=375 RepID=UPI003512C208